MAAEHLTEAQAEQAAAIMLSHFGRDEGYRMAVDLLRRFIAHRPRDFGTTSAGWLRRINRRFDMSLDVDVSTDDKSD